MKKFYLDVFFVNIKNKEELIDRINYDLTKKNQNSVFFYLNSSHFYYQQQNKNFKKIFNRAEFSYLNSFYIGLLMRIIYRKKVQKLNAEDFIFDIFELCRKSNLKTFLLGSDKLGIIQALRNIKIKYPSLALAGHSGYFKNDKEVVTKLENFSPDILIVGLGSKKQEEWVYKNSKQLKNIKVIITVGNFIDILGERRQLPPISFKKLQLEWFFRLIKEPRRLWKRYLFGGLAALFIFIKELNKQVKIR